MYVTKQSWSLAAGDFQEELFVITQQKAGLECKPQERLPFTKALTKSLHAEGAEEKRKVTVSFDGSQSYTQF